MEQRLSAHVPLLQPRVRRFGSRVQTWQCLASHAVVGIPYRKWRKIGTDVSSGPIFLSKKEENWWPQKKRQTQELKPQCSIQPKQPLRAALYYRITIGGQKDDPEG